MLRNEFSNELIRECDFGDLRRNYAIVDLVDRIVEKGSLVVRDLANSRAEQVRFHRVLNNDNVSLDELKHQIYQQTAKRAATCSHVLAIQDSSEVALERNDDMADDVGFLKNRDVCGTVIHPVLALDTRDDFVLGLAGGTSFDYGKPREKYNHNEKRRVPIETKKSFRWIESAVEARRNLNEVDTVTVVGDRESDFYEFYTRVPAPGLEILVRAKKDRKARILGASTTKDIGELAPDMDFGGTHKIELRSRDKVANTHPKKSRPARLARNAILEIRFGKVELIRTDGSAKSEPEKVVLNMVDVREVNVPEDSKPIHWILLTSHEISSFAGALQVIEWYRKRWHIEQLFRSAKKAGLKLNDIQASSREPIEKLAFLGLLASVETLQLTLCRDGKIERDAEQMFTDSEVEVMQAQLVRLEGSTENLRNPYRSRTIAWCHWVIARLGGWKGKAKHGSQAGPKDIKRGLNRLRQVTIGWELATGKDVCIT